MDYYAFICFKGKPCTCKLLLFSEYVKSSEFAEVRFRVHLQFYLLTGNKNPVEGVKVGAGYVFQSCLWCKSESEPPCTASLRRSRRLPGNKWLMTASNFTAGVEATCLRFWSDCKSAEGQAPVAAAATDPSGVSRPSSPSGTGFNPGPSSHIQNAVVTVAISESLCLGLQPGSQAFSTRGDT